MYGSATDLNVQLLTLDQLGSFGGMNLHQAHTETSVLGLRVSAGRTFAATPLGQSPEPMGPYGLYWSPMDQSPGLSYSLTAASSPTAAQHGPTLQPTWPQPHARLPASAAHSGFHSPSTPTVPSLVASAGSVGGPQDFDAYLSGVLMGLSAVGDGGLGLGLANLSDTDLLETLRIMGASSPVLGAAGFADPVPASAAGFQPILASQASMQDAGSRSPGRLWAWDGQVAAAAPSGLGHSNSHPTDAGAARLPSYFFADPSAALSPSSAGAARNGNVPAAKTRAAGASGARPRDLAASRNPSEPGAPMTEPSSLSASSLSAVSSPACARPRTFMPSAPAQCKPREGREGASTAGPSTPKQPKKSSQNRPRSPPPSKPARLADLSAQIHDASLRSSVLSSSPDLACRPKIPEARLPREGSAPAAIAALPSEPGSGLSPSAAASGPSASKPLAGTKVFIPLRSAAVGAWNITRKKGEKAGAAQTGPGGSQSAPPAANRD